MNGDPFRSASTADELAAARRAELRLRLVETARDYARECRAEWGRRRDVRRIVTRALVREAAWTFARAAFLAGGYFWLRWLLYLVLGGR